MQLNKTTLTALRLNYIYIYIYIYIYNVYIYMYMYVWYGMVSIYIQNCIYNCLFFIFDFFS